MNNLWMTVFQRTALALGHMMSTSALQRLLTHLCISSRYQMIAKTKAFEPSNSHASSWTRSSAACIFSAGKQYGHLFGCQASGVDGHIINNSEPNMCIVPIERVCDRIYKQTCMSVPEDPRKLKWVNTVLRPPASFCAISIYRFLQKNG